jgi:phosphoribosylglycinamide formyltransferase-1
MTSQKIKIIILVHKDSAQTNLKAIKSAIETGQINALIAGVFEDNLPLPSLTTLAPDYICLAGWKKIIPDQSIEDYKILNIHPGLIPDEPNGVVENPDGTLGLWNKGLYADKAIQNFIDKRATFAGSSLHYLTNDFDFGPVLGRTFEKILPDDTVESLYARLKKKENELYVEVLSKLTHE